MKMRNEFSGKPLYIKGVQVNKIRETIKYRKSSRLWTKKPFVKEEKEMA